MIQQWLSQEPPAIVVPVPTVVVEPQVTFPPELLERLAPVETSGFTQPWATLLAGCLAVAAAVIAFIGVYHAQKVAIANSKAQLRQQRAAMIRQEKQLNQQLRVQQKLHDDAQERQGKQHAETLKGQLDLLRLQTHAETQRQVRRDVKEAIMEAQSHLLGCYNAAQSALASRIMKETPEDEVVDKFGAASRGCQASAKTLAMLGLDDASQALEQAATDFSKTFINVREDRESLTFPQEWQLLQNHYEAATSAFKLAMLVTP